MLKTHRTRQCMTVYNIFVYGHVKNYRVKTIYPIVYHQSLMTLTIMPAAKRERCKFCNRLLEPWQQIMGHCAWCIVTLEQEEPIIEESYDFGAEEGERDGES